MFRAARGDRPRRLALEVENHEILFRPQDLTQMIVAMDADAESRVTDGGELVEPCQQRHPLGEHGVGDRT